MRSARTSGVQCCQQQQHQHYGLLHCRTVKTITIFAQYFHIPISITFNFTFMINKNLHIFARRGAKWISFTWSIVISLWLSAWKLKEFMLAAVRSFAAVILPSTLSLEFNRQWQHQPNDRIIIWQCIWIACLFIHSHNVWYHKNEEEKCLVNIAYTVINLKYAHIFRSFCALDAFLFWLCYFVLSWFSVKCRMRSTVKLFMSINHRTPSFFSTDALVLC